MKHWLNAFRLRTLPLAVSSILVGSALAHHTGHFSWSIFLLALLTAILLQVLSNLANDLGDHLHGTDNAERVGPQRAVQSGAITPEAMRRAMVICGILAFVSGCALITVALGLTLTTLAFLILGLAAIAAAVKYTFGKNPYGYAGLGDVSVFLFFGLAGVIGSFYLHTRTFDRLVLLPAIGIGLLSTGVLNLNNMRDIVNDAASGKRTLVVRMGARAAKFYHLFLVLGGVTCMGWSAYILDTSGNIFFPALLLPDAVRIAWQREPPGLDKGLKSLALTTFIGSALFALGLMW